MLIEMLKAVFKIVQGGENTYNTSEYRSEDVEFLERLSSKHHNKL